MAGYGIAGRAQEGRAQLGRYAAGMMHEELTVLLDYHYWARDRLVDAVDRLERRTSSGGTSGAASVQSGTRWSTLMSAEWVWCSRWEGQGPNEHLAVQKTSRRGSGHPRSVGGEEERRVRDFVRRARNGRCEPT